MHLVLNPRGASRADAPAVAPRSRPRFRSSGFSAARTGNVGILFALSLVPMIGLVGLGVDYGVALTDKAKLDNAADAAVLAAVATAKTYVADNGGTQTDPTLTDNAIAAGKARGLRAFTVNAGSLHFAATPTPILDMSRKDQTFTAIVSYQTASTNNLGKIFGQKTTTIKGGTSAKADIPSYIDFYLLIDVSGSMGLPATADGQSAMIANTSNSCQFACHFPQKGNTIGWNYAAQNNIQLRSGAVNTAVCGLLDLAAQPLVPKQYRVGLYPFIAQMGVLAAITSNIASLKIQATCNASPPTAFTQLLDTGTTQLAVNNDPSTGTGSGGTHLGNILAGMPATITTYGSGASPQSPKPFVFLITDGMGNPQNYGTSQNGTWYYPGNPGFPSYYPGYGSAAFTGSDPYAINPASCAALKNAGATVSVLYIPYTTVTIAPSAGSGSVAESKDANSNIPKLPVALSSCATSGFFNTANTPEDITKALKAMFAQALQAAHLIN